MSNPRPVLLFVINDIKFLISHRLPVAIEAQRAGFEVHAAGPRVPECRVLEENGIRFHPLELARSRISLFQEPRTIWRIFRLLRALRPDLLHLVTIKPVLYGGIAARLAGVSAVVSAISGLGYVFLSSGVLARARRWAVELAYRWVFGHPNAGVIFQNQEDLTGFVDRGLLRREQTELIRGSGVDPREYPVLPEPAGVPVVLLASRLLRDKGVVEFAEAARMLRERGVIARFRLAGDVDPQNPSSLSRDEIETWVRSGTVEWIGYQNPIQKAFADAAIVCLPSYREGLPKVLIEAAACGKPLISTDAPGCNDIVCDGENGLLVPVRDSAKLADAIEELVRDPALRERLGKNGRARVLEHFQISQVVAQTLGLYRRLLKAALQKRLETPQPASTP